MPSLLSRLARKVRRLQRKAAAGITSPFSRYRDDPVGFAREQLGVVWTPQQAAIARSLLEPPYRTLVLASHNVGKTHLAAGIALWWHLTRRPSIVITTAPKLDQVKKLLWKEIRVQGAGKVRFPGTAGPYVERAPDDFMLGTTAKNSTAFQGHHGSELLFVFDEAVGVDPEIWRVTETMFRPPGHAWLCIFNPTDTASPAYQAEMARGSDGRPLWRTFTMSATEHPNVLAELKGEAPPVPNAIRLDRLNDMLAEWCDPVAAGTQVASDLEWPPGSGRWLRPGPLAEARLLGRWPSQAAGVWSDALWRGALAARLPLDPALLPVIGCDVARFGDDYTSIHVRWGGVSLHHETHNGWSTSQTAGRLKQLAREYAGFATAQRLPTQAVVKAEKIRVLIDDDGVGGGVTDQAGGYAFQGVSGASTATNPADYPNRRSELWFAAADRARRGRLDLSRLPQAMLDRLRQQLLAPTWKLDGQGRRVVEPKADTKDKLGRSPDDADALNLAYAEYTGGMGQVSPKDATQHDPRNPWRQNERSPRP